MPKEFKFGMKSIAAAFVMVVCGTAAVLVASENRWNQSDELIAASSERQRNNQSQKANSVFMYQQMIDDLNERVTVLDAKQNKTQSDREALTRLKNKIEKLQAQQSTLI
jgi:hypothetical protein